MLRTKQKTGHLIKFPDNVCRIPIGSGLCINHISDADR